MICPLHVSKDKRAKAYWDMYLENAAPGHIAPIDAPLLARLCMCLARVDEAEEMMGRKMVVQAPTTKQPIQSPYLAIINRQTVLAKMLASELALPPAQRNRLGANGGSDKEEDPAEGYF
jgi:Phage terminase, small subunit